MAAAVFARAGNLWVVFDAPSAYDLEAMKAAAQPAVTELEDYSLEGNTVLRIATPAGINPRVKRDGFAWILDFDKQELVPETHIESKAQPNSPIGARLFLPVAEPGKAIVVQDSEVGDNLVVVPVIPLGHGVAEIFEYPEVRVLPSVQGVVVQPLIDEIRVRPLRQGVEVSSLSELQISSVSAEIAASVKISGAMRPLTRVLNLERWQRLDISEFDENERDLIHTVALAKGLKKNRARYRLAEFYLAYGFEAEALGVLRVLADSRPKVEDEARFRLLRGASQLFMGRLKEANLDLFHESLDDSDEGAFWRAVLMAKEGDLDLAAGDLLKKGGIIRPYPRALQMPLGLLVAEAAIDIGSIKHAAHQVEVLSLSEPTEQEIPRIAYVEGRLRELAGDFEGAIGKWEEVQAGPHRPSRARAAVTRTELLLKLNKIDEAEALREFERLRFAWRGDTFEFQLLRRMGRLYLDQGGYREGLRTLRQAATHFRAHSEAPDVTQTMAEAFAGLYLRGEADSLPPVTAIALYEEFKELTPAGEDGDEMIRRLADRLVGVDLLPQAAKLLEAQVQFRLEGELRARVGARLAVIHLFDKKPEKALEILKQSEVKTKIPDDLVEERRHLGVQAMVDLGRYEESIELLRNDKSAGADRLRSTIYWKTRDWSNAAQALRRVIKANGTKPNTQLDDNQAMGVLKLAVALTLSGNERAILRLRRDYGGAMNVSPLKDAFKLIATPQTKSVFDISSVSRKVADAEKFQSFLSEYRERLKGGNLSEIN